MILNQTDVKVLSRIMGVFRSRLKLLMFTIANSTKSPSVFVIKLVQLTYMHEFDRSEKKPRIYKFNKCRKVILENSI